MSVAAIVGIGSVGLSRDSGQSVGSLALRAAKAAIVDAGLDKGFIDGIAGIYSPDQATVWPPYVAEGLGLSNIAWWTACPPTSGNGLIEAVHAVLAGACDYALCYHAMYRWDVTSMSARDDPLRRSPPMTSDGAMTKSLLEPCTTPVGLAALMRWHMHRFGSRREHFGMIAVNGRTNAQANEQAFFHGKPISMDDYMAAPMMADPFCLLDMDMPVDVGMALVVTTAERARDLGQPAVLVEASSHSVSGTTDLGHQPFDTPVASRRMIDRLLGRAGCSVADIDLFYPYDGFTILAMDWMEALFCKSGEGAALIEQSWRPAEGRLLLLDRIAMNTHGGNLGEGRIQGMGHILEAVRQLRGQAGPRQVEHAARAIVLNGTNPVNSGFVLAVQP